MKKYESVFHATEKREVADKMAANADAWIKIRHFLDREIITVDEIKQIIADREK